ncbi:hypothetical protein D3C78_329750 [compost metagenome]
MPRDEGNPHLIAGQARSYQSCRKPSKFNSLAKTHKPVTIAAAICANNKSKPQRPNL